MLAAACVLLGASVARAGAPLRPTPSTEGYVTTRSPDALPRWTPSARLLTGYGQRLARPGRSGQGDRLDRRVTSHLLFALGLFDVLELDLGLPVILSQAGRVAAGDGTSPLASSGVGDLRMGLLGTLLHTPARGFGLGLAFDATAPTGRRDRLAGEGGWTYAPSLVMQQRMGRGLEGAVELGYFARPDREEGGVRIGDMVTYRLALRAHFGRADQWSTLAELDGAAGVRRGGESPLVLRGGIALRTRAGPEIGLFAGGAAVPGFGVPDVHALLSVSYAPPHRTGHARPFEGAPRPSTLALVRRRAQLAGRPRGKVHPANDPDGDGVLAQADLCPHVPEDRDHVEDEDGCPDLDDDRDGIRDVEDLCPRAPEVTNGYADEDGCPDVRGRAGRGRTYTAFDADRMLPQILFAAGSPDLDEDARGRVAQLAELLRLNPWIETIEIEIRVQAGRVPAADRRLAAARAQALRGALRRAGVADTRVRITDPRGVPPGHPPRVRLAVRSAGTLGPDPRAAGAEGRSDPAVATRASGRSARPPTGRAPLR